MVYHILDNRSLQCCLSAAVGTSSERMNVEIAEGSI